MLLIEMSPYENYLNTINEGNSNNALDTTNEHQRKAEIKMISPSTVFQKTKKLILRLCNSRSLSMGSPPPLITNITNIQVCDLFALKYSGVGPHHQ